MASYLTRYLSGDCKAVWQELINQGASAVEPPLLNESMAVAEEIVRRIVNNADIVGRYLQDAGYEFATPGPFVVPADQATAECVRQIEEEFGDLPLILKVWWSHVDHPTTCRRSRCSTPERAVRQTAFTQREQS